jgi:hypothetical protein
MLVVSFGAMIKSDIASPQTDAWFTDVDPMYNLNPRPYCVQQATVKVTHLPVRQVPVITGRRARGSVVQRQRPATEWRYFPGLPRS